MRIAIDLHAAQVAPDSDDGRYALDLALALAADPRGHQVFVLLNAARSATVLALRARFAGLLQADAIRNWSPVQPRGLLARHGAWMRTASAVVYRGLVDSLQPDAVFFSDPQGTHHHPAHPSGHWLPGGALGLVRSAAQLQHLKGMPPAARVAALDKHPSPVAASVWTTVAALAAAAPAVDQAGLPATAGSRLRLAYVSPVPPVRSGIADYSASLLAALAEHYDIDVVTDQPEVDTAALPAACAVRTVAWFREHGGACDRVMYHFGNSPFHAYMPELCERYPGVVFLHDFFLGDLLWAVYRADNAKSWYLSYYASHGYLAVRDAAVDEVRHLLGSYPVNFGFLRHARGVVVHSEHARTLAAEWLPDTLSERFRAVPLIRQPAPAPDRAAARTALGIPAERLLLCCFGHIGPAKGNLEIVQAWALANVQAAGGCELVFVGANEGGEYGARLDAAVTTANAAADASPIRIVGWTSQEDYLRWLDAADVAVQLRTLSRGESSAAALDCMNHGLPTVVNRRGALAELPEDGVYFVDETFTVEQLAAAMATLCGDASLRAQLSARARDVVRSEHAPRSCAAASMAATEAFYRQGEISWHAATRGLAALPGFADQSNDTLAHCSNAVVRTLPPLQSGRRLFLDVSAVCRSDLRTGIQRVVRALLLELLESPPAGYRIEPVYITDTTGHWGLHYAQRYTARLLEINEAAWATDDLVEFAPGDVFLGLDFSAGYVREAARLGIFDRMREEGVRLHFVVYDLLPLLRPDVFPDGTADNHERWLRVVLGQGDSVVCISRAVAGELKTWARDHLPAASAAIGSFHLGADMASSAPTRGMPADAPEVLERLGANPTFLAVGTVEPRKGVAQALAAFDQLWAAGRQVNLVLVGKAGWHVEELVAQLRKHPENGIRLFWLEGISDEFLEAVYSAASCLLAPSEGEGFGLPLIEAAQKGLPILARDIPVFREVAGAHAFYFRGTLAQDLARAVEAWLALYAEGRHPCSEKMPWLTWRQSAAQLLSALSL
ncbi:MAG: glycosyltransferase [Pseudomonadota bacterium]